VANMRTSLKKVKATTVAVKQFTALFTCGGPWSVFASPLHFDQRTEYGVFLPLDPPLPRLLIPPAGPRRPPRLLGLFVTITSSSAISNAPSFDMMFLAVRGKGGKKKDVIGVKVPRSESSAHI
jgi:hypothetical protein